MKVSHIPVATIRQTVQIPVFGSIGRFSSFSGLIDSREHIAIAFGQINSHEPPLVRIHSECLTGDVFGSGRCDCGEQLREAVETMSASSGIVLYLRQEGRGIGLYHKLDAYSLQDKGHDTFEANRLLGLSEDERSYVVAAQMLKALGVEKIRLLTNNPDKAEQLGRAGIEIVERRNTQVYLKQQNSRYLVAKVEKAGHHIDLPDSSDLYNLMEG